MTALIIELMPPMHLDAGMNNSTRLKTNFALPKNHSFWSNFAQEC